MEIPLRNKKGETVGHAICSPEDFEDLNRFKWHAAVRGGYPQAMINEKTITMHKYLMNPVSPHVVDHINGNVLDNQRNNLRVVTRKQNAQNKTKTKNANSKFYGVFKTSNGKFKTVLAKKHIGVFASEIEAALVYDTYLAHHPECFQRMNWPERRDELSKAPLLYPQKRAKTSKYCGVTKRDNRYVAQISVNKKVIQILSCYDELQAAKAYDEYVVNNLLNRPLNFAQPVNLEKTIKTKCIKLDEETVELLLPNGHKSTIDNEDYDQIKHYVCYTNQGYVQIIVDKCNKKLSRYIMGASERDIIDHIDGNPLNNTKKNLRISDFSKNAQNKQKAENKSSQYIGVYKFRNTWRARIVMKGKKLFDKGFNTDIKAARYRDLYILTKIPDSHYKLNFEWTDDEKTEWREKLWF